MKGRYQPFKAFRVKALWGIITSSILLSAATMQETTSAKIIIKTESYHELVSIVSDYDGEVESLISYPDPSEEALDLFGDYYIVSIPGQYESLIGDLQAMPSILTIERDQTTEIHNGEASSNILKITDDVDSEYTPDDPVFANQWDKEIVKANIAWTRTRGNSEVTIAILDTGVDTDHDDLDVNIVGGYNFVDDNTDTDDVYGHGTQVAGIAAARIDNGTGIAGMAGNASIMPVNVVSSSGLANRIDVVKGIVYAVDKGAKVINMSIGFSGISEPESLAIEYAWNNNVVVCASSGNDGVYHETHYPSSYDHVLSVGATTKDDDRAMQSNHGENVDVYAPGKSVWSTVNGGGYATCSGTSFASPQVAGLAALVVSLNPEYSSQEVWDVILSGADNIQTDVGDVRRINALGSIDHQNDPVNDVAEDEVVNPDLVVTSRQVQSGSVRIEFQTKEITNYQFKMYNAVGQEVFTEEGSASSVMQIKVGEELSSGAYFWIMTTENVVRNGKVTVIR